jgi:hypothetical protein
LELTSIPTSELNRGSHSRGGRLEYGVEILIGLGVRGNFCGKVGGISAKHDGHNLLEARGKFILGIYTSSPKTCCTGKSGRVKAGRLDMPRLIFHRKIEAEFCGMLMRPLPTPTLEFKIHSEAMVVLRLTGRSSPSLTGNPGFVGVVELGLFGFCAVTRTRRN